MVFFEENWDIANDDLVRFLKEFFKGDSDTWNETFVCLILKKKTKATNVNDFRSIISFYKILE